MTEADLELIRRRAYELWGKSGRAEGAELQFWLQAERELIEGHQKDDLKKTSDHLEGELEWFAFLFPDWNFSLAQA